MIAAFGSTGWAGGIYYTRNIAFQLSQSKRISERYKICVYTNKDYASSFCDLPEAVNIVPVKYFKHWKIAGLQKLFFCLSHRAALIYGNGGRALSWMTNINWIPDFQEKYMPELFSEQEIASRDRSHRKIAASSHPLVFSSRNALEDFRKFYGHEKKNIAVFPFVSYIEPAIRKLTPSKEQNIMRHYRLEGIRYACVMNQFWQHKNHITVIKALQKYYALNPESKFVVVFTGELSDYRNPEYVRRIESMLKEYPLSSHVRLLGFIDRDDQIAIMKRAEFVIQPSLFEGWGTVAEDAKVLDKTILLSDIPVHREQMNRKCILFDPHDDEGLCGLIESEVLKEHHDDIEKGIADMYARAKEYTREFEDLLFGREDMNNA